MLRTRGIACALAALVVVGAGCSSGSKSWDASHVSQVRTLAGELARAFPGDCRDLKIYDRNTYVNGNHAVDLATPEAAGSCTVKTETIEITSYASASDRDRFVTGRERSLCGRAASVHLPFPGLRWVVGGTWAMQPDSEPVSQQIAAALHATYRPTQCPNAIQLDWDPAGAARATQIAAQLRNAGLGCSDYVAQDHDTLSQTPAFKAGLPAGLGRCSISNNPNVDIATFNAHSIARDSWVTTDLAVTFCPASKRSVAIVGLDYAVFTTDAKLGARIESVLGNDTAPHYCGE